LGIDLWEEIIKPLLPLLEEIERVEAAAADPDGFLPPENKDIPKSG
jgi:hypothetical protein